MLAVAWPSRATRPGEPGRKVNAFVEIKHGTLILNRASLLGASRQASTQWRLVGTLAPFGRCEGDGKGAKLDAQ